MTDAHCHCLHGARRHLLCEPFVCEPGEQDVVFYGTHPWYLADWQGAEALRARLLANPSAGVGEIGLDRLKDKTISQKMRDVFEEQFAVAADLHRPVVLHGAKCWGEVVAACRPYARQIPAFLFHGFSRSGGLIPDILELNGFISVGPAVLNDHAINYRKLVCEIPLDHVLVESDAQLSQAETVPSLDAIVAQLATLRGMSIETLAAQLERNLARFLCSLGNAFSATDACFVSVC